MSELSVEHYEACHLGSGEYGRRHVFTYFGGLALVKNLVLRSQK